MLGKMINLKFGGLLCSFFFFVEEFNFLLMMLYCKLIVYRKDKYLLIYLFWLIKIFKFGNILLKYKFIGVNFNISNFIIF